MPFDCAFIITYGSGLEILQAMYPSQIEQQAYDNHNDPSVVNLQARRTNA